MSPLRKGLVAINIFLLESSNISKFMNQNPVLFLIADKNKFSIPLMNLLCQYFYPSAKTYLLLSLFVSLPLSVAKFAPQKNINCIRHFVVFITLAPKLIIIVFLCYSYCSSYSLIRQTSQPSLFELYIWNIRNRKIHLKECISTCFIPRYTEIWKYSSISRRVWSSHT